MSAVGRARQGLEASPKRKKKKKRAPTEEKHKPTGGGDATRPTRAKREGKHQKKKEGEQRVKGDAADKMQATGAGTQHTTNNGHPPHGGGGSGARHAPTIAPASDSAPVPPEAGAQPARSRAWALINHTRRQHVDIGPGGVHFERDPIRYMRTVLSLAWAASDDMVMLPARHMPSGPYTEALVWPVPSDDAASSSSSSSSGSGSDWDDSEDDDDDDVAYSSDYDSGSFGSDDSREDAQGPDGPRDVAPGNAVKDTAGAPSRRPR
ncbi:hypothetical protein pdul_cds_437 [Pandoravirus dulcis]|uniref:Uncharacterized protein n=1 Tax=Pandoravirus dulcis TaxID=1349409 RepID=A0A291AUC4_9VIRU|nr:hypothetical protein pdul_cds_437 [Pandoravirus dulcis]ATE82508.1 hypothetical protein pdul_cds_437 [Pandoravirus dulcis]